MAAQRFIHVFSSLLVILAAIEGAKAVKYHVKNTALDTNGGVVFDEKVGEDYAKQTMDAASHFIWGIFEQKSPPKNITHVTLYVDDMSGIASTSRDHIHLSARYVGNYKGDVKREVTGVLYHSMTHIWQWTANGQANEGLLEGIADYVRLKAGYVPSHWVKPGQGDRWDHGYEVTAYFLVYCSSLRNDFVPRLNEMMKNDYSDDYFRQLLGKPVDQLWEDYKAKYGNYESVLLLSKLDSY